MEEQMKSKTKISTKTKKKNIHKAKGKDTRKETQEEKQQVLSEWLYLSGGEPALGRLYTYLRKAADWDAQLWEEAGVLEIGLSRGGSVDVEVLKREEWDEELQTYAKNCRADQVYTVTFMEEDLAEVWILMNDLVREAGGIFCQDTEGFLPKIGER